MFIFQSNEHMVKSTVFSLDGRVYIKTACIIIQCKVSQDVWIVNSYNSKNLHSIEPVHVHEIDTCTVSCLYWYIHVSRATMQSIFCLFKMYPSSNTEWDVSTRKDCLCFSVESFLFSQWIGHPTQKHNRQWTRVYATPSTRL